MSDAMVPTQCFPTFIRSTSAIPPMLGVGNFNSSTTFFRMYSPVTMNHEWPKLSRLLLMLFCTIFGSTMSGFYVASFFVENDLRNNENAYLACAGFSDLLITVTVTPVSSVVILSGQWDNTEVCRALQFISLTCTYCYSTFFMFVAVENYYRICRPPEEYAVFLSIRTDVVCTSVFIVNIVLGAVGAYLNLDYDYCERLHYGNFLFRIITSVIFQVIPALSTLVCLFVAFARVKRRARQQIQYRRSHLYERDYSMTAINITAYLLFVIGWAPYIIVVHEFPSTTDSFYYNTILIGLFRSAITSTLYGIFNRSFRRAYGHLFNYCCCKSSLSSSYSNRRRRTLEYRPTISEVRVHIMHQAITTSKSHRTISYLRETREL